MAGERATTIRFSDSMYQRLEAAGELTGLPINSIVVVACLEWLDAHQTEAAVAGMPFPPSSAQAWAKSLIPLGTRKGTFPFDRFSVHAKEALLMAQEEAQKHGQGHIGPEHLLLGLLRVNSGFAAAVLPAFAIDAALLEAHLESLPEKSPIQRLIPTSRTKRVIESAFRLASEWNHRHVGTGHLLMGLVSEADGAAAAVFEEKHVTPDRITAEINRLRDTVGPED
jgi:hypothetical protein